MTDYKSINSSNLEAASYNSQTRELQVKFKNGAVYKYQHISADLYVDFHKTFSGENGLSAGKFFNANIRPLPSEKVEE